MRRDELLQILAEIGKLGQDAKLSAEHMFRLGQLAGRLGQLERSRRRRPAKRAGDEETPA